MMIRRVGDRARRVGRDSLLPAPSREPVRQPERVPTFRSFAEQWWTLNEKRFSAKTQEYYRWRLEKHLIPNLGELSLDALTFSTVEAFIVEKLAESERIRQ